MPDEFHPSFQKRHELEGAPDPFPSLGESTSAKSSRVVHDSADANSITDFPTLAPSAPIASAPTKSAWGSDAGPRIKAAVRSTPVITFSFTISQVELPVKDGKQVSLGEVMKQVISRFKVKIEASTNQNRHTTFYIKAETQKELDKAKRSLLASLSPVVSNIRSVPSCIQTPSPDYFDFECPSLHYRCYHRSQG